MGWLDGLTLILGREIYVPDQEKSYTRVQGTARAFSTSEIPLLELELM